MSEFLHHIHQPGYLLGIEDCPPLPPALGGSGTIKLGIVAKMRALQAEIDADRGRQIKPLDFSARTANELRPSTFAGMVGQARLKSLLSRIVRNARAANRPLGHVLLVGGAGTGKTTFAQVIAHELGRTVYQVKAPIALDTFEQLAAQCHNGDVLIVDECHLQVSGDRRGTTQAADPEVYYAVMEDKRLETKSGTIPFPDVTIIACTTDAGLLPEPFLERFSLQPPLDRYTVEDMTKLAHANARALGLGATGDGALVLARASRLVPRVVNRYMKNAKDLGGGIVNAPFAEEIVTQLNATTLDGLDRDMQGMLKVLLRARRTLASGEVRHQASLSTISTALGHSRDTKFVALFVEPWLFEQGYIAIASGGRALTPTGVDRARQL